MSSCQDVAAYLADPSAPLTPELERHFAECEACRRLRDLGGSTEASQDMSERIMGALGGSLTPVRPLPGHGTLVLGFLAIFGFVSAAFAVYQGTQGAGEMTWLQLAGVLAAILITAILVSISLSAGMVPGERGLTSTPKLVIGSVAGMIIVAAALFPWESGYGWISMTWKCFRSGFVMSIVPAGLVVLLLSRGAPQSWGAIGGGAGLLAGLVGMATVHLGCIMTGAGHIAVGHVLIPLACALLGFVIGLGLQWVTSPLTARRT